MRREKKALGCLKTWMIFSLIGRISFGSPLFLVRQNCFTGDSAGHPAISSALIRDRILLAPMMRRTRRLREEIAREECRKLYEKRLAGLEEELAALYRTIEEYTQRA